MTAIIDHPNFRQPANLDTKLWRYMDFTKFISIINYSELFFSRADLLGDSFEGSYPLRNVNFLRPAIWKNVLGQIPQKFILTTEKYYQKLPDINKWLLQWFYVNSWHANDSESAAMWKMYTKSNESVAIVTTYKKLVNVLPENIYVGLVNYIDYVKEELPEGNLFSVLMYKRKSFSYETEVRAVMMDELPTAQHGDFIGYDTTKTNNVKGKKVNIDIQQLIDGIRLAPTSPKWQKELVIAKTRKYNLNISVTDSELDGTPIF